MGILTQLKIEIKISDYETEFKLTDIRVQGF